MKMKLKLGGTGHVGRSAKHENEVIIGRNRARR